ncbi:hypothetical protein DPMN_112532 [Dreissena polymorpha]|uniref:Uncharacterized protein n=1 Tax=Dreissena polymorpha TaxID=45954 RepID=A0A9D4KGK9_DREPO|nr:hypothetical protein DPMN_112532 [Dreissena polymorpha]
MPASETVLLKSSPAPNTSNPQPETPKQQSLSIIGVVTNTTMRDSLVIFLRVQHSIQCG